ncbi:hypothetical protein LDO32_02500 [Luteimonas sp. Y-2-2-4F]|nr:hypothetical protein [Luteimonas sp. Y-2-2-4F]MCD9030604.1 hypothetical protein [Luteimonas sp. Y-2-2-4F]
MPNSSDRDRRRARGRSGQRGDVLLEALIGVALLALLGAGLGHVAARVAASQRDAKVESFAVEQLRLALQMDGLSLCEGSSTAIQAPWSAAAAEDATVQCSSAPNVTLGFGSGASATVAAPPEVALEVSPGALGMTGGDRRDDGPALVVGTRQLPQ